MSRTIGRLRYSHIRPLQHKLQTPRSGSICLPAFTPAVQQAADRAAASLIDRETSSVRKYQSKAPKADSGYNDVNSFLRFGTPPKRGQPWVDEVIEGLDSAISKGSLPENVQTFRAVRGNAELIDAWKEAMEIGVKWQEKGFFSTSASPSVAPEFWGKSKMPVLFQVEFSAGTKAAFPSAVTGHMKEQLELLMQRGLSFYIQSIDVLNGITVVKARLA